MIRSVDVIYPTVIIVDVSMKQYLKIVSSFFSCSRFNGWAPVASSPACFPSAAVAVVPLQCGLGKLKPSITSLRNSSTSVGTTGSVCGAIGKGSVSLTCGTVANVVQHKISDGPLNPK
jgi:hypothetical protein